MPATAARGILLAMLMLVSVVAALAQPVSVESLLSEMVNRDALARLPSPAYTCAQSSSYDRESRSPDKHGWFANNDAGKFVRIEERKGRKEWVMHDAAGPGAVVRIWSANPKGVLRVYLDGAERPTIEVPMTEILGGKWKAPESLSYNAASGWNLYLPIPYAKHCTITSDADGSYYHVNYRTYVAGTEVTSFDPGQLAACASAVARVDKEFTTDRTQGLPAFTLEEKGVMAGKATLPGDTVEVPLPVGSFAITGMMVSIKARDLAQATRSCIIKAKFDGEQAIWCPVGDFFGSGVGLNRFQDQYRSVGEDGWMRCRWVMPWEKTGTIEIENLGTEPVQIDFRARYKPWKWDENSMHFHAAWHREWPIHTVAGGGTKDFNYVDIQGRGVYVGDTLSVMNPIVAWWGEGDEKIYVDGEAFPSHFGTGTEDYYGYAWCKAEVFTRPFHAQPRCDGEERSNNWGRSTVTRSRSLDAIPFAKSLSMNMEVWHWKECDVEFASTAYFYARPGATTNRAPEVEGAKAQLVAAPPLAPPVAIAGAIEFESMRASAKSEGLVAFMQLGFDGILSHEKHIWVQAEKIGDFVEYKIPGAARAKVKLYATKSWDYGIVRLSVNGQKGAEVDLCSGVREVKSSGPIDLGEFEPVDGNFTIRAEVVGVSEKSVPPRTYFGLDCVVLEPVKKRHEE